MIPTRNPGTGGLAAAKLVAVICLLLSTPATASPDRPVEGDCTDLRIARNARAHGAHASICRIRPTNVIATDALAGTPPNVISVANSPSNTPIPSMETGSLATISDDITPEKSHPGATSNPR